MPRLPAVARLAGAIAASAVAGSAATVAATGRVAPTPRAATRDLAPRSLHDALRPTTPGHPTAAAYVVLQLHDCSGNLDFLTLFERDDIRDRLPLAAAIALGPASDIPAIRGALATRGFPIPILHADPRLTRSLHILGPRSTPYLLVLDARGTLRYSADAPGSIDDLNHLAGAIRWLADTPSPATDP